MIIRNFCHFLLLLVKKELTTWSSWSTCPVTCADGYQSRNRKCDLDDDEKYLCDHEENEKRKCKTNIECPSMYNNDNIADNFVLL